MDCGIINYGTNKLIKYNDAVENLCIDSKNSWLFTNDITDLDIIKIIGNKIIINPDKELKSIAQINHWQIMNINRKLKPC